MLSLIVSVCFLSTAMYDHAKKVNMCNYFGEWGYFSAIYDNINRNSNLLLPRMEKIRNFTLKIIQAMVYSRAIPLPVKFPFPIFTNEICSKTLFTGKRKYLWHGVVLAVEESLEKFLHYIKNYKRFFFFFEHLLYGTFKM